LADINVKVPTPAAFVG